MVIRNFKPSDAASLTTVFHEAVRALDGEHYNQAQLKAWSPKPVPAQEFLTRVSDGRFVFVAVIENDKPVGFIELEKDGHIDYFYCHPNFMRIGVGSALYEKLEVTAVATGQTRLYTEASGSAYRFFLSKGYSLIERQDFERNNVLMYNYLMEKNLRSRSQAKAATQ